MKGPGRTEILEGVSEFELPVNLVAAAEAEDEPGSGRHIWMADLPLIVEELAARWSLDVGRPFQPGGVASWVAPARNAPGDHPLLKVGWRHDEALHEADGLLVWNGDGAVRLFDALMAGDTSALLLEA